jgi:transposase
MIIIGVDYHPSDQYIAFVDTETGEYGERQLSHSEGEAEKFYRELAARGVSVRVGMEATGYSRWFERLLAELGIEVWIGDAAEIKTKRVRKQKTDREDARLLLRLLRENNFPRIWVPSPENRDLRQLLWHRHRMVQMRTRIMNQLQALAMNEGQRRKKKLWSEAGRAQLEKLPLAPWASRRRKDLLDLLDRMNPTIEGLTTTIEQEARKRAEVLRLMTHPGVGPITALAFVLIIGTPERFKCGKQIGSYVGLIPCEDSSAGHQRLGHITKQALCCVSCWEKQRKPQRVGMLTGDDGTCIWRCAGKGTSPRWPWPEDSRFGCTGCGGIVGNIQSGSSSVRTRDSSDSGMA